MPSSRQTSSSSKTGSSTSRANAGARSEVIAMLKEDHKRVKKSLRDFERLKSSQDSEACRTLVEQVCNELTLHTKLEEEFLYPAAKGALKDADLVNEAEVEHGSAKALIEQLKGMSPDDEKYAATFIVLGEYVKHHVKEEESEMFPQLGKARGIDWEALADAMNARREELGQELMPEDIEAEDESDPSAARGAERQAAQRGRGASDSRAQAASGTRRGRGGSRSSDIESDGDVGGESD